MNRSSRPFMTAIVALMLAIWLMLVQPVATQPFPTGDVNGDGVINVVDVQLTVLVALGVNTDTTTKLRADVNGDGVVNVVDVQKVVNIVLNGNSSGGQIDDIGLIGAADFLDDEDKQPGDP